MTNPMLLTDSAGKVGAESNVVTVKIRDTTIFYRERLS